MCYFPVRRAWHEPQFVCTPAQAARSSAVTSAFLGGVYCYVGCLQHAFLPPCTPSFPLLITPDLGLPSSLTDTVVTSDEPMRRAALLDEEAEAWLALLHARSAAPSLLLYPCHHPYACARLGHSIPVSGSHPCSHGTLQPTCHAPLSPEAFHPQWGTLQAPAPAPHGGMPD